MHVQLSRDKWCDVGAEAPNLSIPLHTLIKLTPRVYTCDEERLSMSQLILASEGTVSDDGSTDGDLTEKESAAPSC